MPSISVDVGEIDVDVEFSDYTDEIYDTVTFECDECGSDLSVGTSGGYFSIERCTCKDDLIYVEGYEDGKKEVQIVLEEVKDLEEDK